jgi:alpha-glucosidase
MLSLYRAALAHRPAGEGFAWLELGPGLLGFQRDELTCVVNFGSEPATLPTHTEVVLSSGPLPHGTLPADTTAWLR